MKMNERKIEVVVDWQAVEEAGCSLDMDAFSERMSAELTKKYGNEFEIDFDVDDDMFGHIINRWSGGSETPNEASHEKLVLVGVVNRMIERICAE